MTPTWDATDLDSGTSDGVVHESTPDTSYDNASEIRKGDVTGAPLFASDLEAWYPLQGTSGPAKDFSGNNNDGTVSGAQPAGGTSLCGTNTYSFDGTNDYIEIPDSTDFDLASGFTFGCWFYNLFDDSIDWEGLISRHNGSFRSAGYSLTIRDIGVSGHQPMLYLNDSRYESVQISEKEWTFVAFAYDGTDINWVVDEDTGTHTNVVTPGTPNNDIYIGTNTWNVTTDLYKGSLADARVYNRALSKSEMEDWRDVFRAPSTHTAVKK